MNETENLAAELLTRCQAKGWTIATAESCTGGGVAAALTSVPGSSKSFLAGLVCYSNRAKIKFLLVERDLLKTHGAVSAKCATAMAQGAREASGSDLALSTTGVAGPGGGSEAHPVGDVYIGVSTPKGTESRLFKFGNISRSEVRAKAIIEALLAGIEHAQ